MGSNILCYDMVIILSELKGINHVTKDGDMDIMIGYVL